MGVFSSIGKIFNDVTGVSNSAKINNQYQKEFAQNAHQWEMKDYEKAGLNPALTAAGGNGASAGGSGGSAGSAGINPFTMISGISEIYNSTKATNANSNLADAQTLNTIAETENIPQRIKNETINALANKLNAQSNATNAQSNATNAQTNKFNAKVNDYKTAEDIKKLKGGKIADTIGTWYWN